MKTRAKLFYLLLGAAIPGGVVYWAGMMMGFWGAHVPEKEGFYVFHSPQVTETILVREDRTYTQHLRLGDKWSKADGKWDVVDSNPWEMELDDCYRRFDAPEIVKGLRRFEKPPATDSALVTCRRHGWSRRPRLVFYVNGRFDESYYLERVDTRE